MTENWDAKVKRISSYYGELVDVHGYSPAACDYGKKSSQWRKFETLADIIPLNGKSVLDVGCGFADFADYLEIRYGDVDYSGVDITADMIAKAKQRHPELNLRHADIMADDFTGEADVVTANGIFYLLGDNAFEDMCGLITKMFSLANMALAFNSLSSWASVQEENEFYADPAQVLDFCKTLTMRVTLRHDYLPHDFAVYLFKE